MKRNTGYKQAVEESLLKIVNTDPCVTGLWN